MVRSGGVRSAATIGETRSTRWDDRDEPDTQHPRRDARSVARRVNERLIPIRVGRADCQVVPTAEQRQLATTLYGTYVALVGAGFTEVAALAIVTAMVSSASAGTDG